MNGTLLRTQIWNLRLKLTWEENVSDPKGPKSHFCNFVIWLFIYNWGFYLPKFNSSEMLCILGDVSNQRQPIHEQWWWEREAGDRGGREAVLDCGCLAPPVQMISVIWLSTGPEPARLCSYGCLDIFIIFILNSRAYYLLPSYIWCPRDEEFSPNEESPWETHKGTKGQQSMALYEVCP